MMCIESRRAIDSLGLMIKTKWSFVSARLIKPLFDEFKISFKIIALKDNYYFKKYSPEVGEPLNKLRRVVLVEFNVGEVHFQHLGARVSHPEEHQLGLAQMHWGQCGRVHRS